MALIKCPECGKEISDKASNCPNCGCPMQTQEIKIIPSQEMSVIKTENVNESLIKKRVCLMKLVFPMVVGIIILIISIVYNIKVIKPKNTYVEATKLLDNGQYDEANNLLSKINTYKDVKEIQEEVQFETYAYSCINEIKQYLKNPDSFSPYKIMFYNSAGENHKETVETIKNKTDKEENYPVCIMHYTAQNGFGGNTASYAMFSYSNEKEKYEIFGTCKSLDEGDYNKFNNKDICDLVVCRLVNYYQECEPPIGKINLNRIKTVLKHENYKPIKIIE